MVAPPSPPYLGPAAHTSSGDNKPIHRIVIHCTVSPCERGGARDIASYFRSPRAGGSAQYVADPGESVQVVKDSVIAWHAPPNPHSIGYELCDPMAGPASRWDDQDHRSMLLIAARDVAQLCLAYGVPVRRLSAADLKAGLEGICGHVDVSQAFRQSTHWDPGPDFPWKRFMRQVEAFAGEMGGSKLTGKPPTLWMAGPNQPEWTKELKRLLNLHGGEHLPVDGRFGKPTREALVRFRRANKIRPYRPGVAGPAVWRALGWKW